MTPAETAVVEEFRSKGGVFAEDEDGDLHAVVGERRCGLYGNTSAAPFLIRESNSLRRREFQLIRRSLIKAAKLEREALRRQDRTLPRLRLRGAGFGVVWEDS